MWLIMWAGNSLVGRPPSFIAPQQLDVFAVFGDAHDAEVGLGVPFYVLEVLARARDDEVLADEGRNVEVDGVDAHQRDGADHLAQVEIGGDLLFVAAGS